MGNYRVTRNTQAFVVTKEIQAACISTSQPTTLSHCKAKAEMFTKN